MVSTSSTTSASSTWEAACLGDLLGGRGHVGGHVDVLIGAETPLEIANRLAEALADLRQPSGTENQHHNQKNND